MLNTFSHHPSLGSRHSKICHRNMVVKVTHCFPLILCFKISYWEVIRNLKSLNYRHFPKMCCLPQNMSKNSFFFKKASLSWERSFPGKFSLNHWKVDIKTVLSMCITFIYVFIVGKIYSLSVGENEKLSDITKIGRHCANQVVPKQIRLKNK